MVNLSSIGVIMLTNKKISYMIENKMFKTNNETDAKTNIMMMVKLDNKAKNVNIWFFTFNSLPGLGKMDLTILLTA